jgi:hypothetical protein
LIFPIAATRIKQVAAGMSTCRVLKPHKAHGYILRSDTGAFEKFRSRPAPAEWLHAALILALSHFADLLISGDCLSVQPALDIAEHFLFDAEESMRRVGSALLRGVAFSVGRFDFHEGIVKVLCQTLTGIGRR